MSKRKRINLTVSPEVYARLQAIREMHGFKNACELVAAFVHILLDRLEPPDRQQYDLPEDDGEYISGMFDELGHIQPTPDGNPPKRHNRPKTR